jgi:coenzyme F420-reducing hydrogenase beta subunit
MTRPPLPDTRPCCLECGHCFAADELAGMTAWKDHEDLCIVDCARCGAHNVLQTHQEGGLDHQPEATVLRTVNKNPETGEIFERTVEQGTDVHPVTSGSSNQPVSARRPASGKTRRAG